MPDDKSKTDKSVRSQVADAEESEIDYLVRKAAIPREKAREVIKRLRKQSRNTQEPMVESINPMREHEYAELESKIRTRAYQLWEEAGRPRGRELEHWVAAEGEVAGRSATTLWGPNDAGETLPVDRTAVLGEPELSCNDRNDDRNVPRTSDAPESGPNMAESPSASCLQRKINTPIGLPLSRPVSDG